MEIYVLIYEENSDCRCGANAFPYISKAVAQLEMEKMFKKYLELLRFDRSKSEEDYYCAFNNGSATIVMGIDTFSWRIEKSEVKGSIAVAVEVSGGMVQHVYASSSGSAEIFDLDSLEHNEDEDLSYTEIRRQELKNAISEQGLNCIY